MAPVCCERQGLGIGSGGAPCDICPQQQQQLAHPDVACTKEGTKQSTFEYGFALSKSKEPSELRYAVAILDGLVKDNYEHQVDCMYGSATALYLLGDYEEARVSFLNSRSTA